MRKVPFLDSLRIIGRGSRNWPVGRPIVVSKSPMRVPVIASHCDHGGPRDESKNLNPADYRRYEFRGYPGLYSHLNTSTTWCREWRSSVMTTS
jgi:hypothetical protein